MADQEKKGKSLHEESGLDTGSPDIVTHSLGIAGRTARTFINTPVTPMLLVAALMIGLMGLFFTPQLHTRQYGRVQATSGPLLSSIQN